MNSVGELKPAFWAGETQRSLFVENKALAIANTRLENILSGEGQSVHRTILSYPASSTYTPGSDITSVAVTGSKETLTVSTWLTSRVVIDDTEKVQSIIAIGELAAKRMMKDHNNRIEQAVLSEVTNANHTLDDGSVGGTAGNNAIVNVASVSKFFIAADTKLDAQDAPIPGRTAVIGGHFLGQLKLQQATRNTVFGDGVNTRGVVTNLFGWDILYSNNLPYEVALSIATNPTDGDTFTIAGVTFTFQATLTVAGGLHIGTAAANTVANMVVALNALDTAITEATETGYQLIDSEDIFMLRDKRRVSAVATSATVTTISGFGDIVVSETLTDGTDTFSGHRQDALFLVKGAIDLIVQIPPKVEVGRVEKQWGDNIKSLLGYGKKTYADGAREMVRVKVDASTSDWS